VSANKGTEAMSRKPLALLVFVVAMGIMAMLWSVSTFYPGWGDVAVIVLVSLVALVVKVKSTPTSRDGSVPKENSRSDGG
jgi:MFS superfamily sulfate permease-like transporter